MKFFCERCRKMVDPREGHPCFQTPAPQAKRLSEEELAEIDRRYEECSADAAWARSEWQQTQFDQRALLAHIEAERAAAAAREEEVRELVEAASAVHGWVKGFDTAAVCNYRLRRLGAALAALTTGNLH